jgi:hypothetical protein
MAIAIQANDDRHVLVATSTGELTFAEFLDFIRTFKYAELDDLVAAVDGLWRAMRHSASGAS